MMLPSDTPEAVVQAALDAAAAQRWQAVFDLIDESDLPRWRRVTLSMLRHVERQSDAEAVLAGWGARSAAELESLPDAQLFSRWMHAFSLPVRARTFSTDTHAPDVRRVVLGAVREGDELAHVVYREIVGKGSALRLTTLRRTPGGWRLKVDYDLFGTASLHFGPPQPASSPIDANH